MFKDWTWKKTAVAGGVLVAVLIVLGIFAPDQIGALIDALTGK